MNPIPSESTDWAWEKARRQIDCLRLCIIISSASRGNRGVSRMLGSKVLGTRARLEDAPLRVALSSRYRADGARR